MNSNTNLVSVLRGNQEKEIPFWFMRQAGRYLPEYRELRSKNKNFLEFCYHPEMAATATLQPIQRFGMSAAIIFSDILVVPHALGAKVWFEEGKGPQLDPITTSDQLSKLSVDGLSEKLAPVYKALQLSKAELPKDTALIGFAGSPWTLACYMIEGKGSRDFQNVRSLVLRNPEFFKKLIALLSQAVTQHCMNQIEAGAQVIQLFDSWSGVLSENEFNSWSIQPTDQISRALKAKYPHLPLIGFPRLSGSKMLDYIHNTNIDALSFDGSVTLDFAKDYLQPHTVLQGNLDSILLAEDKNQMLAQAKHIIKTLGNKSFVFNLAHGILPHTPIENVQALCDLIRSYP